MKIRLYHGTSLLSALSILKYGFNFSKCGSNWGCTYGNGIYFTPYYNDAKFYAGDNGLVLSFDLNLRCYYLKKDISPSKKLKFKVPYGYNCLVNPKKDEYIIFSFEPSLVDEILNLYNECYMYKNFPIKRNELIK